MFGSIESLSGKVSASFVIKKNMTGECVAIMSDIDSGFFVKTILGFIQLLSC